MNCQGQRTLFLKANGQLVCEDDAGEQVVFATIGDDLAVDLREMIGGPLMNHMRASMTAGQVPWQLVCTKCAFFRPNEPYSNGLNDGYVQKLQVETTLACKLRCGGCNGFWQLKNRPQPAVLSLEKYSAMLEACLAGKLPLQWVEYCGQGEPLSHRKFPNFMSLTARLLPATRQRVITNGNFNFDERFPEMIPDELIVSGDGVYQESYEQYRVNGEVHQVLAFIKRAAERAHEERYKTVIWKYIIFSHNDSDEEIIAAQHLAKDFGVDRLLFVMTHTANKSRRFSPFTDDRLPIVNNITTFNYTPVLDRSSVPPEETTPADLNDGHSFHVCVDEITGDSSQTFLRGWSIGDYGISPSEMWVEDLYGNRHAILVGQHRADVAAVFRHWDNLNAGFSGTIPLSAAETRKSRIGGNIFGRTLYQQITPITATSRL